MNRKSIVFTIFAIMLLILILWFGGIIPKQIARVYATNYMKNNFPEMQLKFESIEWNKYYGDYIITFKDNENQTYGCTISPKYFPINLGQGKFAIEEKYRDSYNTNTTLPYVPDGVKVADQNDMGIPTDDLKFNRSPDNVTIEVIEDTITNKSVEILITDNNEDKYGWGTYFGVQRKVNGEWKNLNYINDNVMWNDLGYLLNEKNQLTLKENIEAYYGELSKGTYRIVKHVYDKEYIDIYSNEFEIK